MWLERMHVELGAAAAILLGRRRFAQVRRNPPRARGEKRPRRPPPGTLKRSAGSTGSSGSGSTKTITVGVLTDITGPGGRPRPRRDELGVEAGIGLAAQEGYKIKYIIAEHDHEPHRNAGRGRRSWSTRIMCTP